MGPIQASLNQLSLTALGTIAALQHTFKGGFKKEPQVQQQKQPEAQTKSGMGNIAKVGRDYSRTNLRAYAAAAKSIDSANDVILEKSTSRTFSVGDRLAQLRAASSLTTEGKGEKK